MLDDDGVVSVALDETTAVPRPPPLAFEEGILFLCSAKGFFYSAHTIPTAKHHTTHIIYTLETSGT